MSLVFAVDSLLQVLAFLGLHKQIECVLDIPIKAASEILKELGDGLGAFIVFSVPDDGEKFWKLNHAGLVVVDKLYHLEDLRDVVAQSEADQGFL